MVASQLAQGELTVDTAPPRSKGLRGLLRRAREMASVCMLPLMQRAARPYVGGETLDDALAVTQRFILEGFPSSLALWNSLDAEARQVADEYAAAIERIANIGLDSYLSIKPPALRFDCKLAEELAVAAQTCGIRLHCDSHGVDVAEPTFAMLEAMLKHLSAENVSMTIPGRWSRSLSDALWAVERGCKVRVVKGEWADPADPRRDMAAGFLEVIDRLAGRARHVAVASHNVPLAAEAIARLRNARTSCELELLFGLPMTQSLAWARANDVAVRVYIPYGPGYIPHALKQLRRHPRIAWWIVKDLMTFKGRAANG